MIPRWIFHGDGRLPLLTASNNPVRIGVLQDKRIFWFYREVFVELGLEPVDGIDSELRILGRVDVHEFDYREFVKHLIRAIKNGHVSLKSNIVQ